MKAKWMIGLTLISSMLLAADFDWTNALGERLIKEMEVKGQELELQEKRMILDAIQGGVDSMLKFGFLKKKGWMSDDWKNETDNITYLLDLIVNSIPAPTQLEGTPQMLVTSLDYSSYEGRIS